MRVLFLSYAESHSNKWVNALCKRGYEIFFVVQRHEVNQFAAVDSRVNIIELPISGKKGYILNAYFLNRIVRKIKPDVVNVHYASGYGTMARLANTKNELLSVWGSDVYDFPYKNKICMKVIRKNLLHAVQIASTSNCMAHQTKKIIGEQRKIAITPFGVDVEMFSSTRYHHEKKDTIVIGNIKCITPKYGIKDLINAFALLCKELKEDSQNAYLASKLRCAIYGSGEQKEEIDKLIKDKKLEECVFLMGEITHSQVPKALNDMDIFCATSILDSESFGVSVVEAQAMGLPVVVTDVDGFKEVVEDGVTGIVVERENIREICNALKKLVLNQELRISMGEQGRKRVLEKYNFEDNVATMESIYLSIVEEKND